MRVQLLTFPGCPSAEPARDVLRRALAEMGLPDGFEEVDVSRPETPEALRGWGSPTILVDGRDVAGAAPSAGAACRLYTPGAGEGRGAPALSLVLQALHAARGPVRRRWMAAVAALPAALLALLPTATCPACLPAYGALLSSFGLGVLVDERVMAPLVAAFLVLGLASVAWTTRRHGRWGPLVVTLLGSLAVVAGRLAWNVPAAVNAGVALLIAGAAWNAWLQVRRRVRSPAAAVTCDCNGDPGS
jgi:hypothetical protein